MSRGPYQFLFRHWLRTVSSSTEPELFEKLPVSAKMFSQWVATLSDRETRKLVQHIISSCEKAKLNITWLYNHEIDNNPIIKQTLEEVVILSGMTYAKMEQVKNDLVILSTYQKWNENPFSRKQKEFTQDLFTQLKNKGLVTNLPAEMVMTSEKKRAQFIVKEIRDLAQKDRFALNQTLEVMLFGETISTEAEHLPHSQLDTAQNSPATIENRTSPVLTTATTVEA